MPDFMKALLGGGTEREEAQAAPEPPSGTRERLREMLLAGKLDDREVEIEVAEQPSGVSVEKYGGNGDQPGRSSGA